MDKTSLLFVPPGNVQTYENGAGSLSLKHFINVPVPSMTLTVSKTLTLPILNDGKLGGSEEKEKEYRQHLT